MIISHSSLVLFGAILSLSVFGAEGVQPVASPSASHSAASVSSAPAPAASPSKSNNSFIPDSYQPSSVSPSASPSGSAKLNSDEVKFMQREFDRAQRNEMRALDHRFTIQRNEQAASQKTRRKEFEDREKELRHKFFNDNLKGSDRRVYVRAFLDRRKALLAMFKDEKEQMKREQDIHRDSLVQDQKSKMAEMKAITEKGERPPQSLWPKPGL